MSARHRWIAALAIIVVAGCNAPRNESTSGSPPPAPAGAQPVAGGWYEIARVPALTAYLDTSRIEKPDSTVGRVWFRFVYTTPTTFGADTTLYRALETRQEVNCGARRTRGLEMRVETATGVSAAAPTPDLAWSGIDGHPLNSGVFYVACRALGRPLQARVGT